MMNIFAQLLDLIYKKRCYFCRQTKDNTIMCEDCYEEIDFLPPSQIAELEGVKIYSSAVYGGIVQKLIRAVKYHDRYELAEYQGRMMYEFWQTVSDKKEMYTILPVPLHKKREKERGYNPMYLVAKEFARLSGYEVNSCLVQRVKNTKAQYKLTAEQRKENLKGAFYVDKSRYRGGSLLIIDDILTSGSTLSELIRELKKSGITDIVCFTTSCTQSHI